MAFTTSKDKVASLFIQPFDCRDSGFVRDETSGTPYEDRLDRPSKLIIPNEGYMYDTDGKTLIPIRYIAGCPHIEVQKQKELGIEPHKGVTDKIVIEKTMRVYEDGADVGKYRYLKNSLYRSDLEKRGNATPLYTVVDTNKAEEEAVLMEEMENEAAGLVYSLQSRKGSEFVYQEERIDSWCEFFAVFGESYSQKIRALVTKARSNPKDFLERIKVLEQTAATYVSHALQLNVIKFEGDSAVYMTKNKIIKNILGLGKMKPDEKIESLAQYLLSNEGKAAYEELKTEVEVAKKQKENN